MEAIEIARVAHEINRAYCLAMGDTGQPMWKHAPEWQRESAVSGVLFHLANPDATPEQTHAAWLAEKRAAGWKWGPLKDAEKKEHPSCVEYADLDQQTRAKDYIFGAVVRALAAAI
jgi:hypothetical protein